MFGLPSTTDLNKQLPKTVLFQKFDFKNAQRDAFDADISTMYLSGLISTKTIPALQDGEKVKSIYLLTVNLKRKTYDPGNLQLLSKLIDQRMILVLSFESQIQLAIYYDKLIAGNWVSKESVRLEIKTHNLDTVWEEFVKAIGSIEVEGTKTLSEQIATNEQRDKILKQIELLDKKIIFFFHLQNIYNFYIFYSFKLFIKA